MRALHKLDSKTIYSHMELGKNRMLHLLSLFLRLWHLYFLRQIGKLGSLWHWYSYGKMSFGKGTVIAGVFASLIVQNHIRYEVINEEV